MTCTDIWTHTRTQFRLIMTSIEMPIATTRATPNLPCDNTIPSNNTNSSFTLAIPPLFVYYFLPFQVGMSGCFHVFPIATLSSTAAMHPCAHYLARPFAPCHDWIDASFG